MFNTIRSKLIFSFLLVFVVMAGLTSISYFFIQENNRLVDQAIDRDFSGSIQISELAILAQEIRRYEKEYFMYIGNTEQKAKYEKEWTGTFTKIKTKLDQLMSDKSALWTANDQTEFTKWSESLQTYGKGFQKLIDDVNNGILTDTLSANNAIQNAKNAFRPLVSGTIELANQKYRDASEARRQIKIKNSQMNLILISALAITAAFCLTLILIVPRTIIKPIKSLTSSASTMSQGALETPVPASSIKDFDELSATLERMRISLKALLQRAASGSKQSAT